MLSSKYSPLIAACLGLAFAGLSQAQTQTPAPTARCADSTGAFNPIKKYQGTYSFTLENDLFANRDRDYSAGFKAAWSSPNVRSFADDDCLPYWLQRAGQLFTQVYSPTIEQGNVTFTVGQAMYTPRDKIDRKSVV